MPSIIHKKSVEGFGIAYVEAAQYGYLLLEEKMVVHQMQLIMKKHGLICDGNNLDDIYSSINSMLKIKNI